jgi:hypothetical protein
LCEKLYGLLELLRFWGIHNKTTSIEEEEASPNIQATNKEVNFLFFFLLIVFDESCCILFFEKLVGGVIGIHVEGGLRAHGGRDFRTHEGRVFFGCGFHSTL